MEVANLSFLVLSCLALLSRLDVHKMEGHNPVNGANNIEIARRYYLHGGGSS
jgi:hypothetical protein